MTGSRYLLVSCVLIAFASIVSASYYGWGGQDGSSWNGEFKVGGPCDEGGVLRLVPALIDCDKRDAKPRISSESGARVIVVDPDKN